MSKVISFDLYAEERAKLAAADARIAALEAELAAAREREADAEEQAEEARRALRCDLDEWEADCSRELRNIAAANGFTPEPDGDTADTIGEHIRLTIEQLRGQVEGYRNVLAAAREREAALAAALEKYGPCPQCGGYGRAGQMWSDEDGEAMCYSDMPCDCGGVRPDEILAAVRREARRAELLKWLGRFGYHAPGENTVLDEMRSALDAEEQTS